MNFNRLDNQRYEQARQIAGSCEEGVSLNGLFAEDALLDDGIPISTRQMCEDWYYRLAMLEFDQ